jgi:hypothetical protein
VGAPELLLHAPAMSFFFMTASEDGRSSGRTPDTEHYACKMALAIVAAAADQPSFLSISKFRDVSRCDVLKRYVEVIRNDSNVPKRVTKFLGDVVDVPLGKVTVFVTNNLLRRFRNLTSFAYEPQQKVEQFVVLIPWSGGAKRCQLIVIHVHASRL